jgi:hypothetical protein
MSTPRMFQLQPANRGYPRAAAPLSVPWSVADKAYGVYASRYGRSQSLERLAERGGFAVEEMDELYPPWREEVSEIAALRAEQDRLREALGLLLDSVDYTTGACGVTEMVGAALQKVVLMRARAALATAEGREP